MAIRVSDAAEHLYQLAVTAIAEFGQGWSKQAESITFVYNS